MYSKVRILGHPIHPMLVAYPIAFYTGTLVAFIINAARSGDVFWFHLAVVLNVAGIGMAVVAALPGFVDWAFGIPKGSPAKMHGATHMLLNVAALALFTINAVIHAMQWSYGTGSQDRVAGIVLAAVGVACTGAAGFFGWVMIQDDHVGIKEGAMPSQTRPVTLPRPAH